MLAFLHDRVLALRHLLDRSSEVLAKYNRLDLDLAPALHAFLDEAVAGCRALGRSNLENQLLTLKAQFVSAVHGTHPLTLERVIGHRRELVRAIALRVLQQSAEQLRADIDRDGQTLSEGRAHLRPIVLLAIRKGLISLTPRKPPSQAQLDALWRALLKDADASLAARQVALQVGLYDIQLLLSDLIQAARATV